MIPISPDREMILLNSAHVAMSVLLLALAVASGSAVPVQAQIAPTLPSAPMHMPTLAPDGPGTMTDPTPEQQKCLQEFTSYRTEVETRARAAAAESKNKPTRARMCELVSDYATAELAWLKFAETNMAKCGIPRQMIEQMKTVHLRTVDTKKKMCGPARLQGEDLGPPPKGPPPNGPRWCADCLRLSDGGGLAVRPMVERAAPNAENHDVDISDAMVDAAIADMARRMNVTPARLDEGARAFRL